MSRLTPDNHELMGLVRERINTGYPMTGIAKEVGVDINDLCDWIMRVYREPKKRRTPYVNRMSEPVVYRSPSRKPLSMRESAQKFAAYKRLQDGARATREALEG